MLLSALAPTRQRDVETLTGLSVSVPDTAMPSERILKVGWERSCVTAICIRMGCAEFEQVRCVQTVHGARSLDDVAGGAVFVAYAAEGAVKVTRRQTFSSSTDRKRAAHV